MTSKPYSLVLCILISLTMLLSAALPANAEDDAVDDTEIQVPRITIVTEDGNGTALLKKDGYVNASVSITDTDGSMMSDSVQFKVRGNTTAMDHILKKAYTFKFSKKKDVLGMGKGKKWALIANAFDPTLLRNYTAFELAYELGLEYASNQRFVELWVDGSYRGCYTLYEPVQEGKDRVDIDIESNDGMNDFLIEYEAQRVEDDVTYFTVDDLRFISSEPEEPTDEQLSYISDTMKDIIATLKRGTREDIEAVIDVESFSKYYLLNELFKTYDFDMSSVFFYYKDGKLYAGPPWDYDISSGNENGIYNTPRIMGAYRTTGIFAGTRNLLKYICDKQWFNDVVKNVYNEHYAFIRNMYIDGGLIDTLSAEYAELFERNYAFGTNKITKHWLNIVKPPLATYQQNLDYFKNWLKERDEWLSDYFGVPFGILGDVDGDGEVGAPDAVSIQRKTLRLVPQRFNEAVADVDGDSEITIFDAAFVQRYEIKLFTPYKIGEAFRYPKIS